jgi:hypothetical protein
MPRHLQATLGARDGRPNSRRLFFLLDDSDRSRSGRP